MTTAPTARDRIAAIEARRAELHAERSAQRATADEELEANDLEALYKLEVEYGSDRIAVIETPMGRVVFRRPTAIEFRQYQDASKHDSTTLERLVRPCVAHPSKTRFDAILNEYPGALVLAGDAVCYLAVGAAKAHAEKPPG